MTDAERPSAAGVTAGVAHGIAATFNALFLRSHFTELRGGGDEPLYLPRTTSAPARIIHTRDYAASALHEAAHWCIAGAHRRRLIDYGYDYVPPPRLPVQQQAFFENEIRAQALESILAAATGLPFRVSHDDPDADAGAVQRFARAVSAEAARLGERGLPPRAARLHAALLARFGSGQPMHPSAGGSNQQAEGRA
jgi:elongation factor P hydroxylase